jgi:hypothetical protein
MFRLQHELHADVTNCTGENLAGRLRWESANVVGHDRRKQ